MTITASILADSICNGHRLTSYRLRYPRFIHAEELTHRVLDTGPEIVVPDGLMYDKDLSRNASSSRAIPVPRVIQDVIDDPAMPIHWGKNQPGMQAREEHDAPVDLCWPGWGSNEEATPQEAWLLARDNAVEMARRFHEAGYHKQIVNRLLEPFAHINVVVTATRWDNFFALRCHEDAQPEIRDLALKMRAAMEASTPDELGPGQWHMIYMPMADRIGHTLHDQIQVSAARAARTSYLTHDGKPTEFDADVQLAAGLWNDGHFSPFEHQATPREGTHANLDGWVSARHYSED